MEKTSQKACLLTAVIIVPAWFPKNLRYPVDFWLISWDGSFVAGNCYMVCMASIYEDYYLLSGDQFILPGIWGWQVSSQATGETLTKSSTSIYGSLT